MLQRLLSLANRLDSLGLTKEADLADSILLKMAQITEEDSNYARLSTMLYRQIISFIQPSIEALDAQWSRSIKRTEEEELKERLGILGYNINKDTPAGIRVEYDGGDFAPYEIKVLFSHSVFSKEVQEVLTNKKGLKRDFCLILTLNDTSEASGGGASVDVSVRDILEGGSRHNVERTFWNALDVFQEQVSHEVTHLDRSGSSPAPGAIGTIRYLLTPGELMAHAHQLALIYYSQRKDDREMTWENVLALRFPRNSSRDKVANYYNLSQPDRISKYQSQVPDIDLSTVATRFLETANTFYRHIKETH